MWNIVTHPTKDNEYQKDFMQDLNPMGLKDEELRRGRERRIIYANLYIMKSWEDRTECFYGAGAYINFFFSPFNFPSIEGVGVGKGQGEREEIKVTIERKNGEVIIRRISNYWTSLRGF